MTVARIDYLMGRRDAAAEALRVMRDATLAGKDAAAEVRRWLESERTDATDRIRRDRDDLVHE